MIVTAIVALQMLIADKQWIRTKRNVSSLGLSKAVEWISHDSIYKATAVGIAITTLLSLDDQLEQRNHGPINFTPPAAIGGPPSAHRLILLPNSRTVF
jgi:hypothetical protein